jgi:hypothetical protein
MACNDCNNNEKMEKPVQIPYIVYESERARSDRLFKRMWIALIVAVALLFASNAVWLWAWTSYDYYSEYVTVDSTDGGNANYIGQDGDIYNGNGYSEEALSTQKTANPNN